MLPKTPTFGQRMTLRQPTLIRRPSDRPEPKPLVSYAAAPLHAPTSARPNEAEIAEPALSDVSAVGPAHAQPAVVADEPSGKDARWAPRTPSRLGAQIQHQSLSASVPCTVRDTSSTGARLEIVAQRGGSISRDRLPDHFTLFMPLDRLEIDCQVMWRQAAQVGVRYTSPARRTAKQQPVKRVEEPKKPHTSLINLLINPL